MSINIYDEIKIDDIEMRHAFCETLIEMAKYDDHIMLLDCDLMGAMGTLPFKEKYPHRVVDCGIQEANMFGVAAGLSASGKIPFAHTFGVFASRRALDQVYISCAYAGQNVKIVGSDPGICAALNGGTHMAFEDLGIMRNIPEMTVIEPTDAIMLRALMPEIAKKYGCFYMRLVRHACEKIYIKGSVFTLGKANVLREGVDVGIIAMGYCVGQSLIAAKLLKERGISARVVDMFTLKPPDREEVIRTAEKTGIIVTAENHQINNALGSTVAEILAEERPTPMLRVGIQDIFGEVGQRDYLAERFGLNADAIVRAVIEAVKRKK